jgi:hypothetical protein
MEKIIAYIGKEKCGHIVAAYIDDGATVTEAAIGRMVMSGLAVEKIKTAEPISVRKCECASLSEKA